MPKFKCDILSNLQTLWSHLADFVAMKSKRNHFFDIFWWFSTTVLVASEIWRSLFLRYVFSFLFINLTLASTGFVLRPQIQRGKIGWMLAKKVGSERGRTQSPAHSVKRKPEKLFFKHCDVIVVQCRFQQNNVKKFSVLVLLAPSATILLEVLNCIVFCIRPYTL